MNIPEPPFDKTPRPLIIENLLAEIEEPSPPPLWLRYLPYFLCACYGAIAWIDGTPFFILFCGILVVMFAFQSVAGHLEKKRNAALVKLLRELAEPDGN